ncbi:hypothetical protein [Steroidobacter agaridevorans]|uniref:hypothetical protein n=1 Tax=Steroidobacter agaridevorans TaxID=2695856 RepID=UPI00132653A7|nr:hypothetical protein [Steroidobacter agaridevorans]GFE86949.1 hypothetical protein GCM10011488_19030 [Steroidobacter agaridevorans]
MATEGANRVASLPASTPAFLRRHPALLVEWLRLVNSLSRWRGEGGTAVLLVLSGLAVVTALLFALSGHVVGAIETLAEYWVLLAVVAAIYAATSVSGRRRQLEESKSQSWLIATPIPLRSLFISHAIRVLLPLVVITVIVVMFPALVALTNEGIAAAAEKVAAAAAGGLAIGGVFGWWTGGRTKVSDVVPSRYVPQPRAVRSMRPDAAGLAAWPIAQVLAWSRPENSRYVLVAALLAVQGGSSAIAGLSVVAMYFVASYLAALLSAMTTVARSAAAWLRATPITLMGFIWSVSRRAVTHQFIGAALAACCTVMLGAPIGMALQVAALWLGLFVSIAGSALVDNYRGRSPAVKIALSVAAFAALATIMQLRVGAKT